MAAKKPNRYVKLLGAWTNPGVINRVENAVAELQSSYVGHLSKSKLLEQIIVQWLEANGF